MQSVLSSFDRKIIPNRTNFDKQQVQPVTHTIKRGGVMKIEVVPRFRIDGKYYTYDELPKETVKKIIEERVDMAMARLQFTRDKTA